MQLAATAFFLALESAGNNNAVKIPMIAMTTNSSIRVNPAYLVEDWYWFTEFYIVVLLTSSPFCVTVHLNFCLLGIVHISAVLDVSLMNNKLRFK